MACQGHTTLCCTHHYPAPSRQKACSSPALHRRVDRQMPNKHSTLHGDSNAPTANHTHQGAGRAVAAHTPTQIHTSCTKSAHSHHNARGAIPSPVRHRKVPHRKAGRCTPRLQNIRVHCPCKEATLPHACHTTCCQRSAALTPQPAATAALRAGLYLMPTPTDVHVHLTRRAKIAHVQVHSVAADTRASHMQPRHERYQPTHTNTLLPWAYDQGANMQGHATTPGRSHWVAR
jgi:hypothetical protein